MEINLPPVGTNYDGFSALVNLYNKIQTCPQGENFIINMPGWFSANMCSPLGAILTLDRKKLGKIILKWNNSNVKEILRKNNFLVEFGFNVDPLQDHYGSTIKYHKFDRNDCSTFNEYVENDFMGSLPKMSNALHKEFQRSIFEIFGNAVKHSETKTIFSCGQKYPARKSLDFSIADVGIGFYKNITSKTDLRLTPTQAIEWAMQENKTTRKGPIPGGLGLKLIKDFIKLNGGKMQIASDYGYWEFSNGVVKTAKFLNRFPGSVVNIEINTDDARSYYLQGKFDSEDIF